MSIKNKVVIITGASSGIGKATALLLAESGAKVVLAARNQEKLEKAVNEIKERNGEAAQPDRVLRAGTQGTDLPLCVD